MTTILIHESDGDQRDTIMMIVQFLLEDAECLVASCVEEALAVMRDRKLDAITSHIGQARQGSRLLAGVRDVAPELEPKVVFITGGGVPSDIDCSECQVVRKPFNIEELGFALRRALATRSRRTRRKPHTKLLKVQKERTATPPPFVDVAALLSGITGPVPAPAGCFLHYDRFSVAHERGSFTDQAQAHQLRDKIARACADRLTCIYCSSRLECRMQRRARIGYSRLVAESEWHSASAYACISCGFWYAEFSHWSECDDSVATHARRIFPGFLTAFSTSEPLIPPDILLREIVTSPSAVRLISPLALERFVADVVRDHANCEVRHVGGPRDRGADVLVLTNGETSQVIQVKQRRSGGCESVDSVRGFIGAMVTEGYRSGMFITTAERFTSEAVRAAGRAQATPVIDRLDLVDCEGFVRMCMEISDDRTRVPWEAIEDIARVSDPQLK